MQWKRMDRLRTFFFLSGKLFFLLSGKHFLKHAVPHRPLLLMVTVDGHSTHSNLVSLKFAIDHKVCFPPVTTHECQPLDYSLFKPLKDYWWQECHKFYSNNPGSVISKLNLNSVFCWTWFSAITQTNFIAGFRTTGVYPLIAMQFLVQDLPAKGVQIRQQKVYAALLLMWLKLFVISGGTASSSNRGLASTNERVSLYWTQ